MKKPNLTTQAGRLMLVVGFCLVASAWNLNTSQATAVEHVIHVSIDGLPGDLLKARMEATPALYPSFARFVSEGATTFNARTDYANTFTVPNHTTMLTGRPVLLPEGAASTTHHGYVNNETPSSRATLHNSGNSDLDYVASTFDVAHDNGLSTALYASKTKFVVYDQSYNATTGTADAIGTDNGRDKIDSYLGKSTGSPSNASTLHADYVSDMATSEFNYSFLHYRDPDSAGHASGWGSADWDIALASVDRYLGDLFQLIESDEGLMGETALVLTSDHGGVLRDHRSPTRAQIYTVPLLVWGPGVAQGADLYRLNSAVRLDPGTGRPDYNAPLQPIRNGDSGNLALNLLGLNAIPGSSINANQDLRVVPEPSAIALLLSATMLSATMLTRRWRQ